jgi:hypothetical protein
MAIGSETLKALVSNELARVTDTRVTTHIRSLLIEPTPMPRDWAYGVEGQQYVCWMCLSTTPQIRDSAVSSGQLEVDFTSDQVGDRDEIAQ